MLGEETPIVLTTDTQSRNRFDTGGSTQLARYEITNPSTAIVLSLSLATVERGARVPQNEWSVW